MYAQGKYAVNIDNGVTGLDNVKTTIYRDTVVDRDGSIKTGLHIEERDIKITGFIDADNATERDLLIAELQEVFSPFYSGVIRFEGNYAKEIDVEPEEAPEIIYQTEGRPTEFSLSLVALNPTWRAASAKTKTIPAGGTNVYYEGTRACGMEITITAGADNVDMENFSVSSGGPVETVSFRTGGGVYLSTGDVLKLAIGLDSVEITKNGINALERIDFTNTVFPKLYPGNNAISWNAHGDEADFAVSIRYTPLYLGK